MRPGRKKAEEEGRVTENIPLFKYIGESSRSSFIRGKNYSDDARLLSTGSHMLKHYLDQHQEEDMSSMVFRMKILSFKITAYERQVHESVLIQQNREHHLLNSRSEFNRCSLPRLTVKLGDKEMSEIANQIREEQRKEDNLEKMIKDWKSRSKKRSGETNNEQPAYKRVRRDNSYRSCEGSREHLFANSDKISHTVCDYDELVETALEEAI